MVDKVKIEDKNNLYRDIKTGAVINTSSSELEQAKKSKEQRLKQLEEINSINDKIDRLTELVNKIVEEKENAN